MEHEYFTVIAADGVPRTHSPRKRYGRGAVHSFGTWIAAKRYRSELLNANPDKKFRIIHTVVTEGGDVFSEIVTVSEEDL